MALIKRKKKQNSDQIPKVEVEGLEESTSILIPTGSTLLNLACSDKINGGYGAGKITNLIGDSSSGKTILAWHMLAEICRNDKFKDYRLIYDDVEAALEINIEKMFGNKTKSRVEILSSDTIEEFYSTIIKVSQEETPFIYILDSLDALSSGDEQKRAADYASEKKEVGGSFKTEKARMISEILRVIVRKVRKTNSFVLIISQTRDNIGYGAMFAPKTRSGGKALKFYCTHEIWLAVGKKDTELGREIGAKVLAKITKNKLTGKRRNIEFPLYYDYGIDDISSSVDFLITEKYWSKKGNQYDTGNFAGIMQRKKIIEYVEENNLEKKLAQIVKKAWKEIEDKISIKRKKRYE